jgi:hypothetical protein
MIAWLNSMSGVEWFIGGIAAAALLYLVMPNPDNHDGRRRDRDK